LLPSQGNTLAADAVTGKPLALRQQREWDGQTLHAYRYGFLASASRPPRQRLVPKKTTSLWYQGESGRSGQLWSLDWPLLYRTPGNRPLSVSCGHWSGHYCHDPTQPMDSSVGRRHRKADPQGCPVGPHTSRERMWPAGPPRGVPLLPESRRLPGNKLRREEPADPRSRAQTKQPPRTRKEVANHAQARGSARQSASQAPCHSLVTVEPKASR